MARRSSRRRTVKPIDLQSAVSEILREYGEAVTSTIEPSVEDTSAKTVAFLETHGDYEDVSGSYRKSFRFQVSQSYRGASSTIFSADPDYRKTHLLEKGHMTAAGTKRTRKFPHWKPAEQYAIEYFEKTLRKNIENVEV